MRLLISLGVVLALAACADRRAEAPGACHVGVYRLADGSLVDVAPTEDGLRWRLMDGRTGALTEADGGWRSTLGWTDRPDGVAVRFGACGQGAIAFAGQAGRHVPLVVRETRFVGDGGVRLAGRLVLPPGDAPAPVQVMVHGSEDYSARQFYFEPRMWSAQGVGVFVYDKRGTGGSEGKYTQDFHVLARDGAAAVAEARRLAGARAVRVGVDGGSQGGWIGPLVATLTPVDYVIARYGLAEGALAEDRGEVMLGLTEKGYGPDVLAKARQVTDATGKVMASDYRDGFEELAAVKRRYRDEPWLKEVEGEFSGEFLKYPGFVLKIAGPMMSKGTSWDYDPMPTLRRVDAPMLWVLAGDDREAPVAETRRRLLALAKAGRPVTVLEFPRADHGMVEFETVDGERRRLRYAEGYFQAVLDFARTGRLAGPYGAAVRLTPETAAPE